MKSRAHSPRDPPPTRTHAPRVRPPHPTPASRWLGSLLAVPVGLLAIIGLLSLRQDRLWIEQEAREQAAQLAAAFARQTQDDLESTLTIFLQDTSSSSSAALPLSPTGSRFAPGDFAQPTCLLAPDGPVSPPECPQVPTPPAWLLDAPARSMAPWHAAMAAIASDDLHQAITLLQDLTADTVPDLAANAQFQLLALEATDRTERVRRLLDLAQRYPTTRSPSGLPLGDLALLQALRLEPNPSDLHALAQAVAERILQSPSPISADLLDHLERAGTGQNPALVSALPRLRAHLHAANRSRTLLHQLRLRGPLQPGLHDLTLEGQPYLAAVFPPATSPDSPSPSASAPHRVLLLPLSLLREAVTPALRQLESTRPRHLGAEIWLGPLRLGSIPSSHPPAAAPTLDSDESSRPGPASALAAETASFAVGPAQLRIPFAVHVTLTDPNRLFARQRQRTWLFGGLIVAAATVAVLGAWLLQQNLQRQLRLNEAKSNFVSSVSHELRAPIASVRLLAESLERGTVQEPTRQREYFHLISQECRRLSALIENVLDLARIEQGRQHYDQEPVDLAALLRATVDLMQPTAADRRIALRALLPTTPVTPPDASPGPAFPSCLTLGDGKALQQALVNLIDNALKHSPPNGLVTVGLERPTTAHPTETSAPWHLYVEDHGEGIPPDDHARIFERFYRRGSELRRDTPGVGIGLSIVQHTAHAHGGRVLLRSAPGQGSRFTLALPWNVS